jgi:leader peptidase (prepilin peptidase)/N-methyltransferase
VPLLFVALAGLLGLLVGSFLNVVIYRLPLMMERDWRRQCAELDGREPAAGPAFNLVVPRSACPACKAPIRALHNIPVLSYLWLRGRCAACKAPIPVRYPLIEAFTGVLSAGVAWQFGPGLACAAALALTWALVALSVIDLDHQLLPDAITLPLLWAGLAFQLFASGAASATFPGLEAGVAGAIAGYVSLWLLYHGFRLVTGKEGMGYGDFKLFAALGAWLGWQMLPLIILLSAFTGAVTGVAMIVTGRQAREKPIPFGPYLAAAGFIALLWGRQLMSAYWQAAA